MTVTNDHGAATAFGRGVRSVLVLSLLLGACAQDAADHELSPDEPVSDDTIFHEVSVTVGADGIVISDPRPITAGEQRAQNELKAALARGEPIPPRIAADRSCAMTSLWYYDRDDWTGNRICFAGTGNLFLADYVRIRLGLIMNWEITRGSLWSGNQPGNVLGDGIRRRELCGTSIGEFCWYDPLTCDPTYSICGLVFSTYQKMRFDLTGPLKRLRLN